VLLEKLQHKLFDISFVLLVRWLEERQEGYGNTSNSDPLRPNEPCLGPSRSEIMDLHHRLLIFDACLAHLHFVATVRCEFPDLD
jgi:hypothetical protein